MGLLPLFPLLSLLLLPPLLLLALVLLVAILLLPPLVRSPDRDRSLRLLELLRPSPLDFRDTSMAIICSRCLSVDMFMYSSKDCAVLYKDTSSCLAIWGSLSIQSCPRFLSLRSIFTLFVERPARSRGGGEGNANNGSVKM